MTVLLSSALESKLEAAQEAEENATTQIALAVSKTKAHATIPTTFQFSLFAG